MGGEEGFRGGHTHSGARCRGRDPRRGCRRAHRQDRVKRGDARESHDASRRDRRAERGARQDDQGDDRRHRHADGEKLNHEDGILAAARRLTGKTFYLQMVGCTP